MRKPYPILTEIQKQVLDTVPGSWANAVDTPARIAQITSLKQNAVMTTLTKLATLKLVSGANLKIHRICVRTPFGDRVVRGKLTGPIKTSADAKEYALEILHYYNLILDNLVGGRLEGMKESLVAEGWSLADHMLVCRVLAQATWKLPFIAQGSLPEYREFSVGSPVDDEDLIHGFLDELDWLYDEWARRLPCPRAWKRKDPWSSFWRLVSECIHQPFQDGRLPSEDLQCQPV